MGRKSLPLLLLGLTRTMRLTEKNTFTCTGSWHPKRHGRRARSRPPDGDGPDDTLFLSCVSRGLLRPLSLDTRTDSYSPLQLHDSDCRRYPFRRQVGPLQDALDRHSRRRRVSLPTASRMPPATANSSVCLLSRRPYHSRNCRPPVCHPERQRPRPLHRLDPRPCPRVWPHQADRRSYAGRPIADSSAGDSDARFWRARYPRSWPDAPAGAARLLLVRDAPAPFARLHLADDRASSSLLQVHQRRCLPSSRYNLR